MDRFDALGYRTSSIRWTIHKWEGFVWHAVLYQCMGNFKQFMIDVGETVSEEAEKTIANGKP